MENYIAECEQNQHTLEMQLTSNFRLIAGKWYYGNKFDGYVPISEVSDDEF